MHVPLVAPPCDRPHRSRGIRDRGTGEGSIVAAGSLCVENMQIPPRSLVMGSPAKVRRSLTDDEVAEIQMYADRYVSYRLDYMGQ